MRWLAFLLFLIPTMALAQDKGFVASTLEQSLSGPGRTVTVTGFSGALSSKATMQEMTIADSAGVWLTLKGVTLDWNRLALLSGKVEVNDLSADDIVLSRLPKPGPAQPPSATAGGFSLPSLPVSVHIGKIAAKRVELGAPVLGQAAVLAVAGNMQLAGGEGAAKLDLRRIDGTKGGFALDASYANKTGVLSLSLSAEEDAGGLISTLIGLPGAPALALSVKGTGPIDAYRADIALATDGQPRLQGKITLTADKRTDGKPGANHFSATLAGDMAPLFAPAYRDFFGPHVALDVEGVQQPDGTLDLPKLTLSAQAMTLDGHVTIGADGLPTLLDLNGRIAGKDGKPVLLPLPGLPTRIGGADLSLAFDAAKGDGWQGRIALSGLNRADFGAVALSLNGDGHIRRDAKGGAVDGTVHLTAAGLAPADEAVAAALGKTLSGLVQFGWTNKGPLDLPQIDLSGADYRLKAAAQVTGLQSAVTVTGQATAQMADLSRLSALVKRPLAGAGTVAVKGTAALLAGSFDADVTVDGRDLKIGQAQVDSLLRGDSRIALSAKRDAKGTTLRDLTVQASTLTAKANGTIQPDAADLRAKLDFTDLAALGHGYGGALSAAVTYRLADGAGHLGVTGTGQNLSVNQPEATRLLRGKTELSMQATREKGLIRIDRLDLTNPQVSAKASGTQEAMTLAARLADLSLVAPGFSGPLTVDGTIKQGAQGYGLDVKAAGPGALSARVSGSVSADFASADLTATGGVDAGVINGLIVPRSIRGPVKFDLRLKGKPGLPALSGRVALGPARVAAPTIGLSADPVNATVDLGGGQARVQLTAGVGGGTVSLNGPIALSAPYAANLQATLATVLFKNPDLYSTHASGQIGIDGPLTGGAKIAGTIRLGKTELRVPSTGMGGIAPIPTLTNVGTSPQVAATLRRAGLIKPPAPPAARKARPFPLAITVEAPNQVFIRGRGLDAELGGTVTLGGTTDDVIPSGGFSLLRGRLDILGKRFDLSEATLQLEGRFVPFVQIAASSVNDGVTSTITIAGQATDPQIAFSSNPAL
ncbi:MAG: translocation/assembly module TamB domain-containing protein, partial [Paracoccaceae bacterium]|nr:translocation/assembly module TamB domain-containing protein [Paracoccaceae bacterium]